MKELVVYTPQSSTLLLTLRHEEGYAELAQHYATLQLQYGLAIEGQRATDQRIEHHTQTPYIRLGSIVFQSLKHFWRSIWR